MEDKQKLRETRNQEKWDTQVKKWQLKYGDPYINKWVDKHPLSLAKLMYAFYLEEESHIHAKRIMAYVSFGIAFLLITASFWVPMFIVSSSIFLFLGNDILTNIRIDRIEQRRWNDAITAIVKAEEKEENEKRNKPMRAKCAKCGDIVEVSRPCEYKSCKCGAISLDYGDGYYSRMGGAPEDFDKEFDKAQGIDRFKPFKLEKPETCNANCDFYTLEDKPKFVYDMNTLTTLVWEWFEQHNLHDPVMQMVKVQEEVGELAHEISRGHRNTPEVEDALGDVLVTVIGMCHHLGYHPAKALGTAYNEIRGRTGKVVEGSFVKDE